MKKIIRPCGLHCIKVNHLGVTIGGQTILEDINLHIHCGSLNVVIGKNGAGKSTLIRAILDVIDVLVRFELYYWVIGLFEYF